MKSPTTYVVAEFLYQLGWRSDCDAQYEKLDNAIKDGRLLSALFSGEIALRNLIEDHAK